METRMRMEERRRKRGSMRQEEKSRVLGGEVGKGILGGKVED